MTGLGWHQFKPRLAYSLGWRKVDLIEKGISGLPSNICSKCVNIKPELKLSDRIYYCNTHSPPLDRDLHGTMNISNTGLINVGRPLPN